jgi:hypothetical protein
MKILTIFLLVSFCACQAQSSESSGEFPIYQNGLIYDELTMGRLSHIVDSLNLKFKSCQPKTFRALPQGRATFVTVNGNLAAVKNAMKANLSLEEFIQRFPAARVSSQQWIYAYPYQDYKGREMVCYDPLPVKSANESSVRIRDHLRPIRTRGWVYEDYDNELNAFFIHDMSSPSLPEEYARLVQYVDCMIDTTAEIYLNRGQRDNNERYEIAPDSHIGKFLTLANIHKGKPADPKIDWDSPDAERKSELYSKAWEKWDNERILALDQKMKWVPNQNMLQQAVDEAIENRVGNPELEFYVARYLSAEDALQMKRMRRPVGFCSQDRTPRIHAAEICKLAAVTAKWDIFLRAHLDIMNDNFDRRSDGSYAWAGRGTYLKELEALEIDAVDLLIGTGLRSENVSDNHYFADIGRIGRALSETKDPQRLEERLVKMIGDSELDLFNRLLMAYIFRNYNYHLTDEKRKADNITILRNAVATMPHELAKGFVIE